MLKFQGTMDEYQYTQQVLQKPIQAMIHLYKRTILNDCEHFLKWFDEEAKSNERIRLVNAVPEELYISMQFLMEQWFIVEDLSDAKKTTLRSWKSRKRRSPASSLTSNTS